jgi:hypothetical protein
MTRPSTTKALTKTAGTVAVGAALMFLGSQELPWINQAEAASPAVQRHSHNHPHDGLTWPPQPRGIGNVVLHSDVTAEKNEKTGKQARFDRLEQRAKGDMRAVQRLGNRFTRVTIIDQEDDKEDRDEKGRPTVVSRLVLFSHENNATVEVGFDAKEQIVTVSTTPAQAYQPEITDEEIKDAEKLARKYFIRQGFKRIARLQAFGILAYKPEGTGFYDTRVIYISFHKDNDSPPVLTAWVDLTNEQVLEVREELP